MKIVLPVFIAVWLVFPRPLLAQVKLNEFNSSGSSDWLEIYNDSGDIVDLTSYSLADSAGNQVTFACHLAAKGFWVIDWNTKLNNAGDTIKLKKDQQVIDCVSYGDGAGQLCEGQEAATLPKLNEGEFGKRSEDGSGGWTVTTVNTKDAPNNGAVKDPAATCLAPSPSPEASPSPQASTSPDPTSSSSSIESAPSSPGSPQPLSADRSPSPGPLPSKIYRITEIKLLSQIPEPVLGTHSGRVEEKSGPDRQLATMLLSAGAGILTVSAAIIIRLWKKR